MKKKILLAVPRMPFPAVSGGEKWVLTLSKLLCGEFELHLAAFPARGFEKQQAALAMTLEGSVFRTVTFLTPEKDPDPAGFPLLPRLFRSAKAAEELAALCARVKPDAAHIIFSEMAQYAAALPPGLPLAYTEIDASFLRPWRSFLRETAGPRGLFNLRELVRAKRYAAAFLPLFRRVTAISQPDLELIRPYIKDETPVLTPNAILPSEFTPPPGSAERPLSVLFTGHYPHFPNEDAAVRLASRIFPLVLREHPAATLTLAGSMPTAPVKALAGEKVEVTGTLDDLRPVIWRSSVFAAPVRYGLGTKGKVLDAFAAGVPVVASAEVAAGLEGARDGEHLLVADSDEDFAAAVSRLLWRSELRRELAGAARRLASEKFNFTRVAASAAEVYRAL